MNDEKDENNEDRCVICFSINSEEPLYSHLNESNIKKLTGCKMHKSCLNQYVRFKYNVEELVDEYFINCPCCKTDICSNLNTVNVLVDGVLKPELAFTLASHRIYAEFSMAIFWKDISVLLNIYFDRIKREIKRILRFLFYLILFYNLFSVIGVYFWFFNEFYSKNVII